MKIIVSKHSGFCFGVKRAVALTEKNLKDKKRLYCLGPLIHNKQVVSDLSRAGLKVIKNLNRVKKGTCVIPSHGIDPKRISKIRNIHFIDTTCPFVFKAQTFVKELDRAGYEVLILGDKDHPEVKGLVGISHGKGRVLANERDASSYKPKKKKVSLVSQTTQSVENFRNAISTIIRNDFQEFRIFNTICNDVIDRQREAKRIAKKADLVIIIGGKNSANTKRLTELCKHYTKAHHIESEGEIKKEWFKGIKTVGIVTGASTPGEFIKKVKKRIKED